MHIFRTRIAYSDNFCIIHALINPTTKTIKAHVCLDTNPTVLLKKLKIAPTKLPTIAGNASGVFAGSLLRASASLFRNLFKALSSFSREAEPPPPSLTKTTVIASTIVESKKGQ